MPRPAEGARIAEKEAASVGRRRLDDPPPPPGIPAGGKLLGRWLFEDTRLPTSSPVRTAASHWITIYEHDGVVYTVAQWPDGAEGRRTCRKSGSRLFEEDRTEEFLEILGDKWLVIGSPNYKSNNWIMLSKLVDK